MPYSGSDDKNLPDHIKKLPDGLRSQWVSVWNRTYKACKDQGGEDCEGRAFKIANGVIKKRQEAKNEMTSNFQFIDLASIGLFEGKPFDAIAPGKFVDMYGRSLEIKADELQQYVDNTRKHIEATKSESGELVGLPIDASNHDKGDGAGWIVDVTLENNRVRVFPKWTEIGLDLISKGIRRFFSATVDTTRKVIMGGTLTNWPASRDHKSGLILLRPVELAEQPDQDDIYCFEQSPGWMAELKSWITGLLKPDASEPINLSTEDNLMTLELTQEQLDERIATVVNDAVSNAVSSALEKALGANPIQPQNGNGEPDAQASELVALLGLEHLEEDAVKRVELALSQQMEAIQKSAETRYMQQLAQVTRKRDIAEFAQRVTGGTPENPRGLPVQADELAKRLLALPKDEQKFWQELCGSVVEKGLIEFAELGHSKDVTGTKQLPAEIVKALQAGELKVSDLGDPILALGDISEYDLAAFNK